MMDAWIRTKTGKRFFPLQPVAKEIDIEDIAHALSNQCRFAGHVDQFYSVAQHSFLVSKMLQFKGYDDMIQMVGLMHDATEAYLVDMPSPVKEQVSGYKEAEAVLWEQVREKFKLADICQRVKNADIALLVTEARDLMGDPSDWAILQSYKGDYFPEKIVGWLPNKAKLHFLQRWEILQERLEFTR
jgi:hypothetical protein